MLVLGPLGFLSPWLLAALAALPAIWLILRVMPPTPRQVRFPGTRLLLGLRDAQPLARHTPWWLLLLRVAAIAALILGFAGPVWKPAPEQQGQGPLLLVVDAGWAAAPDWARVQARGLAALDRAAASGQPAALLVADGRSEGALPFAPANDQAAQLRALRPAAWETRYPDDPAALLASAPQSGLQTLWLSDGLDHPRRAALLSALQARGTVAVLPPSASRQALEMVTGEQPALRLYSTQREGASDVLVYGTDPQGGARELARLSPGEAQEESGIISHLVAIDLPSELRNRITHFQIEGQDSAGAVLLADDSLRRRKVALIGEDRAGEGQRLLSPLHYLRRALAPRTDLIEGGLGDVLQASPDVIVLPDQVDMPESETLREWIDRGGLLIRFAGPRMAAYPYLAEEPLLPVRLRSGGRDIGGALSWGDPRGIAAFPADGPFGGLAIPADTSIRAQLLAEPSPELAQAVLARLSDGTPLVTRGRLGEGQVVLFHTTANAEWSNLAISGLFVDMLSRLVQTARATSDRPETGPQEGETFWTPVQVLDGFGRRFEPPEVVPVAAADFGKGPAPDIPAGLYQAGERSAALNAGGPLVTATWPGARIERAGDMPGIDLRGWLIGLAALLLALDALGSGWLAGGRRSRPGRHSGAGQGGAA